MDFNTSALSQYDMPHITDDDDVQPRIAKWAGANSGTEHMFFAICLGDIVIGYSAFAILFFVCGIIALIRGQGAPLWGRYYSSSRMERRKSLAEVTPNLHQLAVEQQRNIMGYTPTKF